MNASIQMLTRTYISVDAALRSNRIFSERNRQQIEMIKDELQQEIVNAVRARMKTASVLESKHP
jgi:hypothetical protein